MKKRYVPCEMELLALDLVDVLTDSPNSGDPFLGEDDEIENG